MYDWTAPLPPCDWCGGGESDDPETPWIDHEDFWGHAECWAVAAGDPDTIRALREWTSYI